MTHLTHRNGKFIWTGGYATKDLPKQAGFRWDPDNRQWWTYYADRAVRLADHADAAATAALAEVERTIEASHAATSDFQAPAPEGYEYRPFQLAGIEFASRRTGTLIGDEMGLGKTIQAIGAINCDATIQSVLVICPASLKLNWARELSRWLTNKNLIVRVASSGSWAPEANIVIANYDILENLDGYVKGRTWDMLILDEAHSIKDSKALRSVAITGGTYTRTTKVNGKAVKSEVKFAPISAKRTIALTGTPFVNRPVELWTILHLLDPKTWSNFMYFAKRYCGATQKSVPTRGGWKSVWDFKGASNLEELQTKLRSTVMIRRMKEQVLTELPPKVRQIIELPVNGAKDLVEEEWEAYTDIQDEIAEMRERVEAARLTGNAEEYAEAAQQLKAAECVAFEAMAARRAKIAEKKLPLVLAHLDEVVEAGNKVVVMGHHYKMIDAIVAHFGAAAVRVTGRDSIESRQSAVDAFQTDDSVRVFVGNIKAAGVGLTLTAASHVVFAELDWVPGNLSQAEDRCHRLGQVNSVLVQHLVFEGSLDARMVEVLIEKQRNIDAALDGDTAIQTQVSAGTEEDSADCGAWTVQREGVEEILAAEPLVGAVYSNPPF